MFIFCIPTDSRNKIQGGYFFHLNAFQDIVLYRFREFGKLFVFRKRALRQPLLFCLTPLFNWESVVGTGSAVIP